jgi:catechol-2,3-dioxygenase
MGAFYSQVLGWPVRDSEASLVVQAGGTEIRFDAAPAASKPYHHIAWAIPSNQFLAAKAWLARRTPLLRAPDGRDEFHFSGANRRAVYFADPAANILELIARDDVGDRSEGPFGLENILFVNHFGLVVQAMAPAVEAIRSSLKLAFTAPPLDNFAKLGDAHRHLVLVPQGRIWIPEMKRAAEIYPAEAVLAGDAAARLDLPGHPYSLALEPAAGAAQAAAASS